MPGDLQLTIMPPVSFLKEAILEEHEKKKSKNRYVPGLRELSIPMSWFSLVQKLPGAVFLSHAVRHLFLLKAPSPRNVMCRYPNVFHTSIWEWVLPPQVQPQGRGLKLTSFLFFYMDNERGIFSTRI